LQTLSQRSRPRKGEAGSDLFLKQTAAASVIGPRPTKIEHGQGENLLPLPVNHHLTDLQPRESHGVGFHLHEGFKGSGRIVGGR
jgi:hypothetical protein